MHTLSCIVVGIVEKKEKYSPWKEAVGQGFLGQKDGKRHTHQRGKRRDYSQYLVHRARLVRVSSRFKRILGFRENGPWFVSRRLEEKSH